MDGIGPRLTGSPNMKAANEWTRDKLASWGLSNAHLESWGPFGRGWVYEGSSVRMISPDLAELIALPQAWTPGTSGPIRGSVTRVTATTKEELEKYKGKLGGKIVLFGEAREIKISDKALSERYDEKKLDEVAEYRIPGVSPAVRGPANYNREECAQAPRAAARGGQALRRTRRRWPSLPRDAHDGGTLSVQGGGSFRKGDPQGVVSARHGSGALRTDRAAAGQEAGRRARDRREGSFHRRRPDAVEHDRRDPRNRQEGRGRDGRRPPGLLARRHGRHGQRRRLGRGDGGHAHPHGSASSPSARSASASGAARSRGCWDRAAYVSQHFASRPEPATRPGPDDLPSFMRRPTGPLTVKPEHAKLSAYFNLDNGTGKIRGIYAQENAAAVPIFQAWLEPLKDLGATTVTLNTDVRNGSPLLRRRRPARLPVHPGRDRVRDADPPHQHGRLRAAAEGRPHAGVGRDGGFRLQGGHARRDDAA